MTTEPNSSGSVSTDLARGRTHMANERTHLAYLRTTVSLIGFGITINRFSTYLIQNDQAPQGQRLVLHDAGNAGIGMVVLGLVLLLWSLVRYWKSARTSSEASWCLGIAPTSSSASVSSC